MFIHFVINTQKKQELQLFMEDDLKREVDALMGEQDDPSLFSYMLAYQKYHVDVEGCAPHEVKFFFMDGEIDNYLNGLEETVKKLREQKRDIEGNYFR